MDKEGEGPGSANGQNVERSLEEGAAGSFGEASYGSATSSNSCGISVSVPFLQKILAEVFGTYFLIFAGCGSVTLNLMKGTVTLPGIALVWGLVVMAMVYSVGHISGAHFNPAVTIAFATCGRFPWKHVPVYASAQVLGATVASGTLRLLYGNKHEHFSGTVPAGTDVQSLVLEFIITFYLMFVISGVATDKRAIGELAGLAVGATVLINVLCAGPISGASMNPARTLGPAIAAKRYESIWVYIVGPICGAVSGAWAYNLIRFTNKPLSGVPSLRSARRRTSSGNRNWGSPGVRVSLGEGSGNRWVFLDQGSGGGFSPSVSLFSPSLFFSFPLDAFCCLLSNWWFLLAF